MLKGKKFRLLALAALSIVGLTGCDDTYPPYPLDYEEILFDNTNGYLDDVTWGNIKREYYEGVLTEDEVYAEVVNQVLVKISKMGHNYTETSKGTDVSAVIDDSSVNTQYSVADDVDTGDATVNNLYNRASKSVLENASSASYEVDNLFYEKKFVDNLRQQFNLPADFDQSRVNQGGILYTPFMTYADTFGGDYTSYMEEELYDNIRINYLTAEYIFTKNFSAIGNANARKVQVISLTDRSDDPGAARQLLNAYIRDYVTSSGATAKRDPDFSVLSRLWKGITEGDIQNLVDRNAYSSEAEYNEAVASLVARYESVILSDEEEQWLRDNDIILNQGDGTEIQGTLAGSIVEDQKDLEEGYADFNKLDTSLESQYTGTYTYDYRTGLRMAYDDLASQDLVTDGIHLSSDGLSSLPSDLKDRIFSSDFATDKDDIAEMKAAGSRNENAGIDITTYMADGYRYLTTPGTASTDEASSIIYYDTSSSTYYLTRILDVVDNDALGRSGRPNADSVYDTAAKQERIAREVAYAMSTTGSYKTNSTVYWLRRTNIDYSAENFLEYMKSTYNDVFRVESSTDGDPMIDLTD